MENFTHLAPTTFSNSTVEWDIKFNQPITSGQIPVPAYYSNISFFLETNSNITRSNDTHILTARERGNREHARATT